MDIVSTIKAQTSRARGIDVLYDSLDELLLEGRVEEAGAMVREIMQSDLSLAFLLSALYLLGPWREELGDVWEELEKKIGDAKNPLQLVEPGVMMGGLNNATQNVQQTSS